MKQLNPDDVQRDVVLALVLEPLAEKDGCTTRSMDLNPELKLVDFQVSAVNVGRYFRQLAERVNDADGQPAFFYDLCHEALHDSTRYLHNKKHVNWGLLDVLLPVVVSHLVYGGQGLEICRNVITVLKRSSHQDVVFKNKARQEAWRTSRKKFKSEYPYDDSSDNLFDDYALNIKISERIGFAGNIHWLAQLSRGLPLVQAMYRVARRIAPKRGLLKAIEKSYELGIKEINKVGVVADYTAVVTYLLLVDPESSEWVK